MKEIEFIKEKIKEIENDERFHYSKASVFANAPLALIQTDLTARHIVYSEMLKEFTKGSILFDEKAVANSKEEETHELVTEKDIAIEVSDLEFCPTQEYRVIIMELVK